MRDSKDRACPATGTETSRGNRAHIGADNGPAWRCLDTRMTVTADGAGAAAYTLSEFSAPHGSEPSRHVHHGEDEALFLIEGSLRVTCGNHQWEVGPGSVVFLPRAVPHAFVVTSPQRAVGLQLTGLAGFEKFIAEAGRRARPRPGRIR